MTDREKLVELLESHCAVIDEAKCKAAKEEICSPRDCAECLADHLIANGVTVQEWISVEDRLPELPDEDFCGIYVNALYLDTKKVVPRLFSRSIVRGKRVERWFYPSDRLAEAPDFWTPLPEPTKEE